MNNVIMVRINGTRVLGRDLNAVLAHLEENGAIRKIGDGFEVCAE